jgi:hypothetical protein
MLHGGQVRTKIKLKGHELREMQDKLAVISYAIEHTLTDCFIRQEAFELLDSARDCAEDLERKLGLT